MEQIQAKDFEDFANRDLFVIEGKPGYWRRVKKGAENPDGAVKALFLGKVVLLAPDKKSMREIATAGFMMRQPANPVKDGDDEGDSLDTGGGGTSPANGDDGAGGDASEGRPSNGLPREAPAASDEGI